MAAEQTPASLTADAPVAGRAGGFPAWADIFPQVRSLLQPGEEAGFKTATPTVLRGLFIDLADPAGTKATLADLMGARQDPAAPVEIHADVLRISAPVRLAVRSLLIHARRIEVTAGGMLAVLRQAGKPVAATLDVYAGEIALEQADAMLRVEFLGVTQPYGPPDAPGHLRISCEVNAGGGILISSVPPGRELAPGDLLQAQMVLATAKRLPFTTGGNKGERWQLALDMALWVNRCHAQEGGDPGFAGESAALAGRLSGPHRALHTVPALRWKAYHELALHTADALTHVEAQAQLYFARGQSLDQQKAAAADMLAHYDGAKQLSVQLREQVEMELEAAKKAWDASVQKLTEQQADATKARAVFDAGVKKKKAEEIAKAVVAGCMALLTLGIGIAAAFAGNPSGIAQGADKAAEAADKIEKVQGILDRIAKALEVINKIAGYLDKAYKVYDLVSKNVSALGKVGEMRRWLKKDAADVQLTTADWNAFQVEMEGLFAMPIQLEVDGAQDYLVALQKLAIRGRDAIETGAVWVRCDAAHQQRLWEIERDERDIAIVRTRQGLVADGHSDFTVRLFYERMHDGLKLALIQSLDKLADAYRYYALREPGQVASVEMTAGALHDMVAEAEAEMVRGMEAFGAPPARWTPEAWTLSSLPRQQADAALASFHKERRLSWTISPEQIPNRDRLRLSELRLWLVGKELGAHEVTIDIATSGFYRDRLAGKAFAFVTAPLDRCFAYVPKQTGRNRDHLGHRVDITAWANDQEHSYFEPTPFTTWELTVSEDANPGLRIEQVTDIAVEFIGSYVRSHDGRPHTAGLLGAQPAPLAAGAAALDIKLL